MTTNIEEVGNPDSPVSSGLAALVPALAGAIVAYIMKQLHAEEFGEVATSAAVILVGAPIFKRSRERDRRRVGLGHGEVSGTTVAVSIVLGAAAFWLIDVITSIFGLGVLAAFTTEIYSTPSTAFFLHEMLIALPFMITGSFFVGMWLTRRLREQAMPVSKKAVGLYVITSIAANLTLWDHLGSRGITASDVYLPILGGAVTWITCWAACRYVNATQDRFDSTRHVV
jgi:hypothetical protein